MWWNNITGIKLKKNPGNKQNSSNIGLNSNVGCPYKGTYNVML